jgi:ADP-ribosylglycohydrolase
MSATSERASSSITACAKARLSLEGLSVGDAFGQLFFSSILSPADLPAGPWPWTDDTHTALSVVEVLEAHGRIDQEALARAVARGFAEQPFRGYSGGARSLLRRLGAGADWRTAAPALFDGGSYGNGASVRAAPIGGFFGGNPLRAAREARRSAVVTHAHPEGQAGAMAVAAAAAIAASPACPVGGDFLHAVLGFVPNGLTRRGIELATSLPAGALDEAAEQLGTGRAMSAQDTVPFCLWSAAHHLDDFEEALWWTARGLGDCDTTCAIVGGIVALSARAIPMVWLERREALSWRPDRRGQAANVQLTAADWSIQ